MSDKPSSGDGADKRLLIVQAILDLRAQLGRWPATADVAARLDIPAKTLQYHTRILVAEQRVRRLFGGRALEVLPGAGPITDASTDTIIVELIRRRVSLGEFCPTTGEIAADLGLSKSTIRRHIRALTLAGRIQRQEVLREAVRREYCLVERPSEGMVE